MSPKTESSAAEMTFGEHLDALRPHLVRGVGVIVALIVVAFCCKRWLVDGLLFAPMQPTFPTNRLLTWLGELSGIEALGDLQSGNSNLQLVSTTMAGQFNLHLRISVIAAFSVGFPYLLWELWRFVRPALTPHEMHTCRNFVSNVSLGFFGGLLFGYFVIAPLTIGFLSQYSVSDTVVNMIDVNSYLSTVVSVSIACAAVFQLPLLVSYLTRMGILTSLFLRHYRRHAIVVLAILSAVITPPDAFSMVMVLLPLYGLYEYSIHLSEKIERRIHSAEKKID